ncbi:kinase-like domain-containing protein [Syncephalis pseudoplumigaleata]|uniref:Kinase-like domain-containing protein n=1 Tax=Syncephalis pseudoplumigaleata TaxID=1712513 RepID=A0A4P9YXD0_9FUNG|nr:kinase-like domain-containing protein [Syncephalis pseudoplumigaleata]|eukprot:RKP23981.1 kinase-like domain-containing protein [Syncephalis pseudoplumigaleata]
MATYAITDGLHAALPTCWSYLTSSEKNGMVGWVEVIDEATRTGASRKFTAGSSTNCTHNINIDGIEGKYFEIAVEGEDIIILENMAIPVMFADGDAIGEQDLGILEGTCHIVLPGCNTMFVMHPLEHIEALETEDGEYSTILGEKYTVTSKLLGCGGFGSVRLAIDRRTHQCCAVKVADIGGRRAFDREVEVLATVKGHRQFVQTMHAATTTTTTYLFMSRAWGDMDRYISIVDRLPEEVAKHIFRLILEGVQHMHHRNMVHRDIKPENILIQDFRRLPSVVVADLGLACTVRPPTYAIDSWAGTMAYMAPEVMRAHPHWADIACLAAKEREELIRELAGPAFTLGKNAKAADMWSLGATLYYMLFKRLPFNAAGGPPRYMESIICSKGLDYNGRDLSGECKSLLHKLLAVDADDRYTVDEALACSWLAPPSPSPSPPPQQSSPPPQQQSPEPEPVQQQQPPLPPPSPQEPAPPSLPPSQQAEQQSQPGRRARRNWRLPTVTTRCKYYRVAKDRRPKYKVMYGHTANDQAYTCAWIMVQSNEPVNKAALRLCNIETLSTTMPPSSRYS